MESSRTSNQKIKSKQIYNLFTHNPLLNFNNVTPHSYFIQNTLLCYKLPYTSYFLQHYICFTSAQRTYTSSLFHSSFSSLLHHCSATSYSPPLFFCTIIYQYYSLFSLYQSSLHNSLHPSNLYSYLLFSLLIYQPHFNPCSSEHFPLH